MTNDIPLGNLPNELQHWIFWYISNEYVNLVDFFRIFQKIAYVIVLEQSESVRVSRYM